MPTFNNFRDLAKILIDDTFGTAATLTRAGGTYDDATGKRTKSNSADDCFVVVLPQSTESDNGKAGISAIIKLRVECKAGDTITVGETTYRISKVTKVAPNGGDAIVYTAEVKR